MNVQLNPDQSGCKSGGIVVIAGEDLTGKRSLLAELYNDAGVRKARLPLTVSASALFIIDDERTAGEEVPLSPIVADENFRVIAKGTGNPGAPLVLAAPGTPADKGKLRTVPATEGVYFSPGIYEGEAAFVDGQHILVRPFPRLISVGTAFSAGAPAATAPTNSSPYGFTQAQAQAILTNVIELRAFAVAQGWKADS